MSPLPCTTWPLLYHKRWAGTRRPNRSTGRPWKYKIAVLGKDHPDVATTLNNLAALCAATSREGEALELMKQAESIYDHLIRQVFYFRLRNPAHGIHRGPSRGHGQLSVSDFTVSVKLARRSGGRAGHGAQTQGDRG